MESKKNMKADTTNDPRMDFLYPKMPDKSPEKNIEIPISQGLKNKNTACPCMADMKLILN
jgi:hypothetical protein